MIIYHKLNIGHQPTKDNYTKIVSDTQRYKMLGNGWTVDVIAHILSYGEWL
jgi:DNA (cytosine-5)-methyltransferase 3A